MGTLRLSHVVLILMTSAQDTVDPVLHSVLYKYWVTDNHLYKIYASIIVAVRDFLLYT